MASLEDVLAYLGVANSASTFSLGRVPPQPKQGPGGDLAFALPHPILVHGVGSCDRVAVRRSGGRSAAHPVLISLHGDGFGPEGRLYEFRKEGGRRAYALQTMFQIFNQRWRECGIHIRGVPVAAAVLETLPLHNDAALVRLPPQGTVPLAGLEAECRKVKRDLGEALVDHIGRDEARCRCLAASAAGCLAASHLLALRLCGSEDVAVGGNGVLYYVVSAGLFGSLDPLQDLLGQSPSSPWLPRAVRIVLRDRWSGVLHACLEACAAANIPPVPPTPGADPADPNFSYWARTRATLQVLSGGAWMVSPGRALRCVEAASTPSAMQAFAKALSDSESPVFREPASHVTLDGRWDESFAVPEVPAVLEHQEIALYSLLVSNDMQHRLRGVAEISKYRADELLEGGKEATIRLTPLLTDTCNLVRIIAARTFARLGQGTFAVGGKPAATAAATAAALLAGEDLHIRLEAVRTLAQLGPAVAEPYCATIAQAFRESTTPVVPASASEFLEEFLKSCPRGNVRHPSLSVRGGSACGAPACGASGQGKTPEDAAIRAEAAAALANLGKAGLQQLEGLLTDSRWTVRLEATRALGDGSGCIMHAETEAQGDRRSLVEVVARQLEDPSRDVRLQAVLTLEALDCVAGICLEGVAELFCREAKVAHMDIAMSKRSTTAAAPTAADVCFECFRALVFIGTTGVKAVDTLFSQQAICVRLQILHVLVEVARCSPTEEQQLMCEDVASRYLSDRDAQVRALAAPVLAELRPSSVEHAAKIAKLLSDSVPETRAAAARSLGSMGDAASAHVNQLADSFRAQVVAAHLASAAVRGATFEALVTLGSAGASAAASLLGDTDAATRRAAVYACAQLQHNKGLQSQGLLDEVAGVAAIVAASEDETVRQTALHRLAMMGEAGACEVAGATAGREPRAQALLKGAAGDHVVAAALRVPAAQKHAEAKMQRYWQRMEKRGVGISFKALPV